MSVVVLINLAAAFVHAAVGAAGLRVDPRSATNRLFMYCGLLLAWWGFAYAMAHAAGDPAAYRIWYQVGVPAWTLVPGFLLELLLRLAAAPGPPPRPWVRALLHLPGAVFLVRGLTGALLLTDVVRTSAGWIEIPAFGSCWFYAFSIWYIGAITVGLVAVGRPGPRQGRPPRRRAQVRSVLLAGASSVLLVVIAELLLPELDLAVPVVSSALALPWSIGIWWAIRRHELLRLTPAAAGEEILATMTDAVVLVGADGRVARLNRAATTALEPAPETLVGRPWGELLAEERTEDETRLERFLDEGPVSHLETRLRSGSGGSLPVSLSATRIVDPRHGPMGTVLVARDTSDRRSAEERLHHLVHHDQLTGLPNRLLFSDRLAHALTRARRYGESLGVMVLDLDRFKEINDGLGHEAGDLVLKGTAERLGTCVRRSDTVARLGGDEFAVALPDLKQPGDEEIVARRIVEALALPLDVGGQPVRTAASIGIALFPAHGADADALVRAADAAMYRAKAAGRGTWRVFDPAWKVESGRRRALSQGIEEALERGQLAVHYQPLVEPVGRRVVGVEALVRWEHPERGLLSAAEFVPAAEEAGLLPRIGEFVRRTAIAQAQAWRAAGLPDVPLGVNLCARGLADPGLPERLRELLARTGFPAALLELEVTEDVAPRDDADTLRSLERLAEVGVRIAVDDFGTGPASLVFLARFPIRTLKIGHPLVRGAPGDAGRAAVIRTIVGLARRLGVDRVVAEGVETEEQLGFLRALGCDAVQGHLTGRPVSAHEIAALLGAR